MTAGIVSAKAREIGAGRYDDFLQIDAPINRGNSGGPTFNLDGEVIGVNTAIHSPTGGNVGIGFAIPARPDPEDRRRSPADDGMVERGWLGVHIQALDDRSGRRPRPGRARRVLWWRVSPMTARRRPTASSRATSLLGYGRRGRRDAQRPHPRGRRHRSGRQRRDRGLAGRCREDPRRRHRPDAVRADRGERRQAARKLHEDTPKLGLALARLDDRVPFRNSICPRTPTAPSSPRCCPAARLRKRAFGQGDVIIEADNQAVTEPRTVAEAVKAAAERGEKVRASPGQARRSGPLRRRPHGPDLGGHGPRR